MAAPCLEEEEEEHVVQLKLLFCLFSSDEHVLCVYTWCRGPLQQVEVMVDEGLAVVNRLHVDILIFHCIELQHTLRTLSSQAVPHYVMWVPKETAVCWTLLFECEREWRMERVTLIL